MNFRKVLHSSTFEIDRKVYFTLRSMYSSFVTKQIFEHVISHHPKCCKKPCPVCNFDQVSLFPTFYDGLPVTKYYCLNCQHLFGEKDYSINPVQAYGLLDYEKPSATYSVQKKTIEAVIKFSSKKNSGKYLDFGIGGNWCAIKELSDKYNNSHEIYGTDIHPCNNLSDKFFISYNHDPSFFGFFNGISSCHVLEHFENPHKSWEYLNRLLKPIKSGGGVMVHVIPTTMHYHPYDIVNLYPSHVCIYSKRSIRLVSEKCGFKIEKIRVIEGQPAFYFRKTFDLQT